MIIGARNWRCLGLKGNSSVSAVSQTESSVECNRTVSAYCSTVGLGTREELWIERGYFVGKQRKQEGFGH